MNDNLVSIIVPIYNTDKFLKRCIDSILEQSYIKIELILVDNNSTDDSIKICENYVKKDSRVKFFSEKSPGAAAARNRGIREATGEYITFVDSDDYLDIDSIERLVGSMQKEGADMICYSYRIISEVGRQLGWKEPDLRRLEGKIFTGKEAARLFLISRDIEGFCWNKLFKNSLLKENNFCFDTQKTAYEDMAEIFELMTKCEKIIFCASKLYYYRQTQYSLSRLSYADKNIDYKEAVRKIICISDRLGLKREKEVFSISRYVWARFDKIRQTGEMDEPCYYNILYMIRCIFYLKTEKIKTLLKALYVWNYSKKRTTS